MTRSRRCLVPIIGDHFTIAGACLPVSQSSPQVETDAGHAPAVTEAWRPSDAHAPTFCATCHRPEALAGSGMCRRRAIALHNDATYPRRGDSRHRSWTAPYHAVLAESEAYDECRRSASGMATLREAVES